MNPLRSCVPFLLLFAAAACSGDGAAKANAKADQSSPKALAESIFTAARTGDLASLDGIAAADADKDAKNVAGVAKADPKDQQGFRDFFAKGKVDGEPKVAGETAEVAILFGPDGQKPETFNMVKTNGVWFLQSF
jgi:hypothetical protein